MGVNTQWSLLTVKNNNMKMRFYCPTGVNGAHNVSNAKHIILD